jgi:predicted N-acetyltransferase YhbS
MIATIYDSTSLSPPPHTRRDAIVVGDECDTDHMARDQLLDAAFGLARNEKTCQRLRDERFPADRLALVARQGSHLIGTVRLWNIRAGDRAALLLGPLAVAASHRRCGIGTRLMQNALARAQGAGHRAIILVGDADYYGRFGFDCTLTDKLELPGPVERHRFLGLELYPGALAHAQGRVSATGRVQSKSTGLNGRRPPARAVLLQLPNWGWPAALLPHPL